MRRAAWFVLGVVVAAGTPALAQDDGGPRPNIAIVPRTVVYGGTARLTGALVNGPADAGTTVAILQRALPAETMYHEVARVEASAAGDVAFALRPATNTYYAVRTRAEPSQTSLGLLVRVTPSIALRLPPRAVARSGRVQLSGTVRPRLDGTELRVQRRQAGDWATVGRTTLTPDEADGSRFAVRVRMPRGGRYRVAVPATAALSEGASSPRRIRVRR
jgi:hypothetical protein